MDVLPAHNQIGSRNAKHGFPLAGAPTPGCLGWRIRKTMLIRFAASVGGLWWGHFPEVQAYQVCCAVVEAAPAFPMMSRWSSSSDKHGLWPGVVIAVSVPAAAGVLSMVFPCPARRIQGVWGGGFERPCLANLLSEGRGGAGRGEGSERDGCREVGVDKQGRVPPIAEG